MITVYAQSFPLARVFTISRGAKTEAKVVTVEISRAGKTGFGECVPYARYGETVEGVIEAIRALPPEISRAALQELMPAGAARNAVDCALWDLEAKLAGKPVWELAGLPAPQALRTAFTISLDSPEGMQAQAEENAHRPLLKVKLGTPEDLPRLEAVRRGAPQSEIILDANEGWSVEDYIALAPHLQALGVTMVEQPLPAGQDEALRGIERPVPVCADESVHDRASLADLVGKYDLVNIKLDKTGGFTEALALRREAEAAGFGIMLGCMVGSSLAMAPAVILAQGAAFVDLDGPLLLAEDRREALRYDEDGVHPPQTELWG